MEIRGVTEAKKNLYPTIEELPNKKIRKIKTIGISALLLSMILNIKSFASDNSISPENIENVGELQLSGDIAIIEPTTVSEINSTPRIILIIVSIILAITFIVNLIVYIIMANKNKKNKDDEKLKRKIKGLKIASIILLILIIISVVLIFII